MSKGSRPIRVVSSVEGLALKVGIGRHLEAMKVGGVQAFLRKQLDEIDGSCQRLEEGANIN